MAHRGSPPTLDHEARFLRASKELGPPVHVELHIIPLTRVSFCEKIRENSPNCPTYLSTSWQTSVMIRNM
jgi:hypothetical protein